MDDNKLRRFILENILFEALKIRDAEMVTEVVIMYRTVDTSVAGDDLSESFNYTTSRGCSRAMARGIVDLIYDEWAAYAVEDLLDKGDEDGETET